jgi:hypothetical protein
VDQAVLMAGYATGLQHGWEDQAAAIRVILEDARLSDSEKLAKIEQAVNLPSLMAHRSAGGISTGDKTP